MPIPESKFTYWTMDFVTDLPMFDGFNALFVCVDKFSKLCRLVPCRVGENALTAPVVARLFFDAVVRHYGVPTTVLHDRDVRFTSAFWQELWKLLGCKTVFSSAYHPQTDG